MKKISILAGLLLLILAIWFSQSRIDQNTRLDGKFADWEKQACLNDPENNCDPGSDFKSIYWNTNANEEKLYFMIERFPPAAKQHNLICRLYFDINASGGYQDKIDKFAEISYAPGTGDKGQVAVNLYSVTGQMLAAYSGYWGEGYNQGGKRFEFAIPLKDLDVYPAQNLRFFLTGMGNGADRIPDQGDNQLTPFPGKVKNRSAIFIAAIIWLVILLFFYHHRIWVFYYIWGSVGLSCLLILMVRGSPLEYLIERQTSLILHYVLSYLDILTYVFDKAPGTLLVLIKTDTSWTTVNIDIENSGILEMCILCGLVLFYPAYRLIKKVLLSLVGVMSVFLINLLRLLVVIAAINQGGRSLSFIAHTVFGRLVFFILIVVLYWYLLTRPSLQKTREIVNND